MTTRSRIDLSPFCVGGKHERFARWYLWPPWLAFLFFVPLFFAQSQNEASVKAAFVFNLTKYIEWPQPKQTLVIGVVGEGPLAETLESVLSGKSSDGKTIEVRMRVNDDELPACDLVYLIDASPKKTKSVLEKTRGHNILTIGNAPSFTKQGGMIGLVTLQEHVEIQVNLRMCQESKLKVSSRLLNLAKIVESTTHEV